MFGLGTWSLQSHLSKGYIYSSPNLSSNRCASREIDLREDLPEVPRKTRWHRFSQRGAFLRNPVAPVSVFPLCLCWTRWHRFLKPGGTGFYLADSVLVWLPLSFREFGRFAFVGFVPDMFLGSVGPLWLRDLDKFVWNPSEVILGHRPGSWKIFLLTPIHSPLSCRHLGPSKKSSPKGSDNPLLKYRRQIYIRNPILFLHYPNDFYIFFLSCTFASGTQVLKD